MKTSRRKTSPHRPFAASQFRANRRGTVILLVVAVLALLAVIGTVYIVSARTEKANAQSMEAAYNLELARDAIMQQTVQVIGNSLLDSTGAIAGYATTGAGNAISRNYDYPDASEPWLAATLHSQVSPPTSYSQLTTQLFDPSTGAYDITITSSTPVNVVGDQTSNATDPYPADPDGITTPPSGQAAMPDAYYNLLPFSDASGIRYRYALRIIDTNRMANLNTGATDDTAATADTFGTNFTDIRLAPQSGWPTPNYYFDTTTDSSFPVDAPANLQVMPPSTSGLGRAGLSSTSYNPLTWEQQIFRMEKPTDTALAFFDLSDELALRTFGEFGSSYHIRPANVPTSGTNYLGWPNTLSASPANPNSGTPVGNPRRRNYTTYSWSQYLRPFPDPLNSDIYTLFTAGSLPSGTPSTIWPTDPARISVNPLTAASDATSQDLMYYTAMAATNVATLMEFSTGSTNSDGTANTNFSGAQKSFTHEEACAFAANYCTAKWNGFTPDNIKTADGTYDAYYLPAGPSFVDDRGICIRTAITVGSQPTATITTYHREFGPPTGTDTDLHSATTTSPHKIYLGYSAQPFFSEVAATMIETDSASPPVVPGVVTVSNTAVELYNPYNKALSLNGYHLESSDGTTINIDLTGQYVPANGYLVITSGHFAGTAPGITYTNAALKANATGDTKFILLRPYMKRDSSIGYAPVDEIDYSSLVAPNAVPPAVQVGAPLPALSPTNTTAVPADFSIVRSGGAWGPTVDALSPRATTTATIPLGSANAVTATGYPLPDRYCPTTGNTPNQGDVFGMGEFARITRIANEFDGTNATGTLIAYTAGKDGGLVADHIAALTASTLPYTNMVINAPGSAPDAIDAQILFDFYGDPFTYSTTAQPTDAHGYHDIRAARLLSQIALIDRYSEFNIDIGGGANDINKIRLPGRINVNTAAPDVLRAIPNMTDKMVANIVAYRTRSASYTYNGTASSDFSDATKYPAAAGTSGGIHSLAELLVPLADTTATTIDQRDLLWGPICNLCTVRSDTFVVYGYLEAVRQNPKYNGATPFDNAAMWYTSPTNATYYTTALTIDNPNNTGPLVRVGRRRFLAIVDRSFCNQNKLLANGSANSKFILPKIVAIKDLPEVPGAP